MRPRLTKVDRNGAAADHPDYMSDVALMHLTPKGPAACTQLIIDELDAQFPEP